MDSILTTFDDALREGHQVALMPVSRLQIEEPFQIGPFAFYPAGRVNLTELRTVPNRMDMAEDRGPLVLQNQELRENLTTLTGASVSCYEENTLVAFPVRLDWPAFLCANHKEDIETLRLLSEQAEHAMDVIRFNFCHFDVADTLPGRVGTWNGSGPYCSALLYTPADHESYLIAGSAIMSSVVVSGLGLELDDLQCSSPLLLPENSDLGCIIRHALSLFSDVLEGNSWTTKFTRAMTLLEFLATPYEYKNWQKAKTAIVCHVARDKADYHRLCERFRELGGKTDASTGEEVGIRTRLVHHGRRLEDVLPQEVERKSLLRELQLYGHRVMTDMLGIPSGRWPDFLLYRSQLRFRCGVR